MTQHEQLDQCGPERCTVKRVFLIPARTMACTAAIHVPTFMAHNLASKTCNLAHIGRSRALGLLPGARRAAMD